MSKRIAIICNYDLKPNRIGGMDRFYKAYDTKLKELGYTVDWYFSRYEAFSFYDQLTILSDNKGAVQRFFASHCEANDIKYEVVVTHFLALCTAFFKDIKEKHSAYIIAVDHNPRPLEGFPIKKRLKNKVKGRIYSKYIDLLVGVSKYTSKHILNDYGSFLRKKTVTVYNGIETSAYLKKTTPNQGKFIVASHLRYSKGIHDLINAVSRIDKDLRVNMSIDVFGEGPMEAELKEMVKDLQLTEIFNFKGSTSSLPSLFSNYAYMLQPTYMECFSLSILESLAANVPVITTTVGGNPEIIVDGKNGFILQPKDVEGLTKVLSNVLSEKKVIEVDVSHQIETVYNLDNMVADHIKLLSKVNPFQN